MKSFAVRDRGERTYDNGKEDESLGYHHILEEMESFFLDTNEWLTISRMVSDTVIKGMVNAFEEQAAERIAQKDLEVVGLKKLLHNFHAVSDETRMLGSSVHCHEPHEAATHHFTDSVIEHNKLIKSVDSLKIEVHEQLNQLKKEISKIRGPSSIRRISSGSDLVGLGGILQENVPERWIYVDKAFENLKDTPDIFCRRMEIMDQLSKASLSEWQEEQEFRSEIEGMVISNCIRSLQQEFEQKLWNLCDSESRNCFNLYKEISSLRQEMDSLSKTLSVSETGLLIFHGSLENTEDWCHNKRADHFHMKLSTDHLAPSIFEENGKQEDSKINKPVNLDSASLKHMSKDDLVTYITKMRRNCESQVQEKTEENFRLRRELLKERGSSFPLKKDKDFDLLKKKIPDVLLKLDKILVGNEKVHHSSDMLTDKKKEFNSLSSQLSAAEEKLSRQQLTEKNLLQTIQKLEHDIMDAHAEVSIIQDVYKCLFENITSEFGCTTEELRLKYSFMQEIYEIIIKEIADSAEASSGSEIEEADMEATLMHGLLDINHIIFKEALVDANEALKLEAIEKEKLKDEMLKLNSIVEEKEKLIQEAADALVQEKQKMEFASEELDSLRAQTAQQHELIVENSKEMDVTKGNLVAQLKEIEQYKEQMHKLHQNLEQTMNKLREIDEERRELCAVTQKQQDALKLIEAKERESRKQMESTINLIHKLLSMGTDFEARVNEDISRNCLRLENMSSEICHLNNKANVLKTMGLVYKKRLETRCSDLAKAEAEIMDNDIAGTIFYDGRIIENTVEGIQFMCGNPKFIKIKRRMTLEQLKSCIHWKLRLRSDQRITRIVNRLPQQTNVLCYMYHELVDNDDVGMMIFMFDNHTSSNVIQLYVDYETVEADQDVNFERPSDNGVDVDMSNIFPTSNPIIIQQSMATVASHRLNVGSSVVAESGGIRIRDIVSDFSSDDSEDEDAVDLDDGAEVVPLASEQQTNDPVQSVFVAPHRQLSEINLAAMRSGNKNTEVGNDEIWTSGEELYAGMKFEDKESAMMAIIQYFVRRHQNFKVEASDPRRLIVKCPRYNNGCNWRVRVIHSKRSDMWEISKYDGRHNCLNLTLSLDHKNPTCHRRSTTTSNTDPGQSSSSGVASSQQAATYPPPPPRPSYLTQHVYPYPPCYQAQPSSSSYPPLYPPSQPYPPSQSSSFTSTYPPFQSSPTYSSPSAGMTPPSQPYSYHQYTPPNQTYPSTPYPQHPSPPYPPHLSTPYP